MNPVRIALLSTAHVHAAGWAAALKRVPGAVLSVVYDHDASRGSRLAAEHGVPFTTDLAEALAACDAVLVASENVRHAELTLAAAAAGKHVLCEKPLATTVEDGVRMVQACREAGVQLMTAFPCRFFPPVVRARELVRQGRIGRVLAMKGTNHGYLPPGWFTDPALAGGGCVMDHTVHVVDLMRWILGAEVREVYAEMGTLFHPGLPVEDAGLLTLEFENGVFATLDTSWSRGPGYYTWGDVTLEIIGTAGTLALDAFAQHLDVYDHEELRPRIAPWGDTDDVPMLAEFVDAVRTGRPVAVTGVDGLRVAEVAIAAYASHRSGAPVRVERAPLG